MNIFRVRGPQARGNDLAAAAKRCTDHHFCVFTLAQVDPVALMMPPVGLEVGYVPIAMWEGDTKPEECVDVPDEV